MNVLYIDGVGPFGGASRSLFELVSALKEQEVNAFFIGTRGTSLDHYSKVAEGIVVTRGLTRFDNTQYSYYRGLRWLVLLREIFHLPFTLVALARAWWRWRTRIDLIHCNEITEILPAVMAKWLLQKPLIVHVRSAQCANYDTWRSRFIHNLLRNNVDRVIAIDETTRNTLPEDIRSLVIHNSFTAGTVESVATCEELGLTSIDAMRVGFVGNLQVAKGVIDLIKAAALVRNQVGLAIEFVFVGGKTRTRRALGDRLLQLVGLAQDVSDDLDAWVQQLDLADTVHFVGHRNDIQRFYPAFDVLAFPSHFDAPGRPVFEAAFYNVPCLVCVDRPLPDTVQQGETGLCVPAHDPVSLANAILWYWRNPEKREQMGVTSRQMALDYYVPKDNAQHILEAYKTLALSASTV